MLNFSWINAGLSKGVSEMAVEIVDKKEMIIRISSAGACPRRLQLEAWGVEGAPPTEYTLRAFEEGKIHEASILEWAAERLPGGPYTIAEQQREVTIELDWGRLVGHIDAIVINPNNLEEPASLLEAKCLSHRAFQELREKGVKMSHPQYYTQVQLYLHGICRGWTIRQAYLVARDKETPKNRLWDHTYEKITYDPYFVEVQLACLNELCYKIQEKIEIHPQFNPLEDWQCRPPYCPYTKLCWPDYAKPKAKAIVDDSLADVVEQYQTLGEEISDLEKAREELKARLLASIKDRPVMAGRWIAQKVERRQERFDTQLARKELPADVLAKLVKVDTYEQLKIEEVC
ncbi:MAG: hypothetical protein HPY52_10585 [Firmicutes bacterium]|nr:hypothetical protein [Bacillota bacterium]